VTATPDQAASCEGVLVVEDDADILRALVQVLEDEGYAVRAAENGSAALAALRTPGARLPRVILLDLMMPVMDGWAFRAEQLRDPLLAEIPVVVLTADGSAAARSAVLEVAGALRKPVELLTLLAAIQPFLG
jgi:CheY-like chemotaxis protein